MSAVIKRNEEIIQKVAMRGDLSSLSLEEQWNYYLSYCAALELDPATKPFDLISTEENGKKKTVLYANASCAAQISHKFKTSIVLTEAQMIGDVFSVKAICSAPLTGGRVVEATGKVYIGDLKGQRIANAMMKAETKAARRATLRYAGVTTPDETEVADIPGAAIEEIQPPPQPVKQIHNANEYACNPETVESLIATCRDAKAAGVTREELERCLPKGRGGIRQLTEEEAQRYLDVVSSMIGIMEEAKASMREGEA